MSGTQEFGDAMLASVESEDSYFAEGYLEEVKSTVQTLLQGEHRNCLRNLKTLIEEDPSVYNANRIAILITYYSTFGMHSGIFSKRETGDAALIEAAEGIVKYLTSQGQRDIPTAAKLLSEARNAFREHSLKQIQVLADFFGINALIKMIIDTFVPGASLLGYFLSNVVSEDTREKIEETAKTAEKIQEIGDKLTNGYVSEAIGTAKAATISKVHDILNMFGDVLPDDWLIYSTLSRYHNEHYVPQRAEYNVSEHSTRVYFFPTLVSVFSNIGVFLKLLRLKMPIVFRVHVSDIQYLQKYMSTNINDEVNKFLSNEGTGGFCSVFTDKLKTAGTSYALTIPVDRIAQPSQTARLLNAAVHSFQRHFTQARIANQGNLEWAKKCIDVLRKIISDLVQGDYADLLTQVQEGAKLASESSPDFSNLKIIQYVYKNKADRDAYFDTVTRITSLSRYGAPIDHAHAGHVHWEALTISADQIEKMRQTMHDAWQWASDQITALGEYLPSWPSWT
jgi:hypothetical protein